MCSKIAKVYEGFVKIINQFRGTENIFEYRSTTANQLYLLYCTVGKIYFDENIHRYVKYSWFIVNLYGVSLSDTIALACLLFDTKQDIRKLIDITSKIGISTASSIIIPGLVYYNRNQIEDMISEIDKMSDTASSTSDESQIRIEEKKMISYNFCAMFALMFIYSFVCIFDVIFFYDEKKVKNFMYYLFPLPNVEENGSSMLFVLHILLFGFTCPLYWFLWIAFMTIISLWGAKCHNELMYVQDRLNSAMYTLDTEATQNGYQTSQSWVRTFRQILIRDVKKFKTVNRAIDHFRRFVQVFSSLVILINFTAQVIHLYFTVSTEMPFSVRLKSVSFCLAGLWPLLLLYWVGEILENAVSAVSLSVYCSPWHYSVKVRKEVQIFLCQTQRSENLFMWKVYPLVLRNFSRLVHTLVSTVNILRTITLKSN